MGKAKNKMGSEIFIILTFEFKQEDSVWTAHCRELGTAIFGDTLEQAQNNLQEAVLLHLKTLTDVGELWNFLKANDVPIHLQVPNDKITIPVAMSQGFFIKPYVQQLYGSLPCQA